VGGAGSDSLVGGNGIDSFVFNTALQTTGNTDRIGDFTHGVDRILLDDLIFKGIGSGGVLNAANFALGAATTSAHHILYNSTTGVLSYDADGVGGVGAMAFARVTAGFVVTADDFTVF
jgi:Ca2+-binding RTX toxin-like protein